MTEGPALFFDGVSAMPHAVRARVVPGAIRITGGRNQVLDWPIHTLRMVDRVRGELRIAPERSQQRLTVHDPALVAAIDVAMAPARAALTRRRLGRALAIACAVPLLALALWFGWPPLADRLARAMPEAWEEPLGAAVTAAMRGDAARCVAPEGVAALRALTDRLAEAGGLTAPVSIEVLDSPMVNAFAAPGNRVVIFRGLIAQASASDELAGVLAHELGHVLHRHGVRAAVRALGVGAFASILLGGSDLGTVAVALVSFSYSRGFEEEADTFAADVLGRLGYGTEGLASFFRRMGHAHGSTEGIWSYLQTHPDSATRAEQLMRGEGATPRVPALTSDEWAAVRAICRRREFPGKGS